MRESLHPRAVEEDSPGEEIEFTADCPRERLVTESREWLHRAREALKEANPKTSSRAACARYSRAHDDLLRAIFKHVLLKWEAAGKEHPGSLALMALGGYGRRDLALFSDVDILFLIGDRKGEQEAFVKEVLYLLFDLKLDLGYGVRRLEDCLNVIGMDVQSTTSMMESRLLAGSKPLFQHYHEFFFRTLRMRGRKWLLQALLNEWKERHQKYEASVYLIQPNLKESHGGLRDIHSARWALAAVTGASELSEFATLGILTEAEVKRWRAAEDFVLKLRNELHALGPRKNDVLHFEAQVAIAERLGYEATETQLSAENLMRDYYQRAREIAKYSNRGFMALMRREKSVLGAMIGSFRRRKLDAHYFEEDGLIGLSGKQPRYWTEDPVPGERIMALFARARKLGLRVGEDARDKIEKIVPDLGDEFRESAVCRKHFMEILSSSAHVARTLADMHDCGLLSAYLPEFEHVHCMVRMDYYHRYTVDEHLIKAVESFERLMAEKDGPTRSHAAGIAREIGRMDLLNFSLLTHDVGKGFGKGHALRGGQIVQRIGSRIGLDPDDIEILRFLVLSHLKIGHIAQRRDVSDPQVGLDLAEEAGSLERLKMLYVHSVCDSMAVSPESWTDWKAHLFKSCYLAAASAFKEHAAEAPPAPHQPRLHAAEKIWDFILASPPEGFPRAAEERDRLRHKLDEFLESIPDRYLHLVKLEIVSQHFWMIQKLNEEELIEWRLLDGLGLSELVVASADVPGSFAKICGALAAKELNIVAAQIFSTSDGYGVNVFQVTDLAGRPLPEGYRLERLRADLNQVFLEKKTIEELMEKYRPRWRTMRPPSSAGATEIRIDNAGSQEFTILEVRTGDRPGLLFQIASFLDRHKLNIDRALVSTEAYRVVDVFYVTDLEYNKLHDAPLMERVKTELAEALGGAPAASADESRA